MQAPAPASAAPINRYHQPNVFGLSVIPDNARPQYDQVENLRVRQRAVVEEAEAMPDRPSATTAPSLRPTHGAHEQPRHVARPSASSLHDADENAKFGHIRISGNWDRTPISLTLDLDAPGEKFYQAFHQLAARRHRIVERHRTTLWLKSSKDMPEEEAYELRLSEEELEEGWEAAVEWMHENKREKAPHIYVTVEVGPG
ncbi:hypothetical protein BU23DRAFT_445962 [Bimuria novae-zelandiae CBS 107.79]|uniref:Uncharacterized protein n=1 Tax=Bimuria novae-zelandiae CBS 107.79 TaxID=1447943 RepID=A0A6A5VSL4_9PLEO|nr:hypothetical protein BU23DRAFT_445962 [Bimuria novae-zelandiae CBS 107.79]